MKKTLTIILVSLLCLSTFSMFSQQSKADTSLNAWKDATSLGLENDRLYLHGLAATGNYRWFFDYLIFKDTGTMWYQPWGELAMLVYPNFQPNYVSTTDFEVNAFTEADKAYLTYSITSGNLREELTYTIYAGEPYIYVTLSLTNIGSAVETTYIGTQFTTWIAGDHANDYFYVPGHGQGQFTGVGNINFPDATETWVAMWDQNKEEGCGMLSTKGFTPGNMITEDFGIGEGFKFIGDSFTLSPGQSSATYDCYYYFFTGTGWQKTKDFFDSVIPRPDFEISVSPTTAIILHAGGYTSASITLKSLNDFSGSIQLSSSNPSEAKTKISFAQNPVGLSSGGEVSVWMYIESYFDTSDSRFGALGEYGFTLTATDGSIEHDLEITIKLIANTIAINNLANLQQIPKNDPSFTAQQNFLVAAPNGSVLYWVQNIVFVRTLTSRISSTFQIYSGPLFSGLDANLTWRAMSLADMLAGWKIVSFPVVLNLTSYIVGNRIVVTNNASWLFDTASMELPDGSYIVGYSGKYEYSGQGFSHQCPEIAVVSYPPFLGIFGSRTADFKMGTKGSVECLVKLFGEPAWGHTQRATMYANSNQPQTAERALHLIWHDTAFVYSKEMDIPELGWAQGISFSPVYP